MQHGAPTAQGEHLPLTEAPALRRLMTELDDLAQAEPSVLAAHQNTALQALHDYHLQHSPWYRARCDRSGMATPGALSLASLRQLPPMTRADLQNRGDAAFTPAPASHGAVRVTQTSGSSGEPVRVARTELAHQYWMAYGMREHQWWQRDLSQSLFVVRANLERPFIGQKSWGPPASLLADTGPGYGASLSLSTDDLARLMIELKPAYVLVYPSVLRDLLRQFAARGTVPEGLRQIRTMGETLSDELRQATRAAWGVDTVDAYSSQELGVIAIQCPDGDGYHLMAENLVVELLRPDGSACMAGEIGQVVVTDLHNLATPLVRYAIGDLAEAGGSCRCGCRLPMIRGIKGRLRNLITYPGGERRWPLVGFAKFRDIAPIRQYQVVQTSIDLIELRLACQPLSAAQEHALKDVMTTALGHPFPLQIVCYPDGLPLQPNGKHEEVVSLVNA